MENFKGAQEPRINNIISIRNEKYDIGSYATNPNHEEAVRKSVNYLSKFKDVDAMYGYIKKTYPNTPVTKEMILNTSNKYQVPHELITAIMINDSSMGTKGKAVRTKNPGNVGNTDDGSENNFKNWETGVDAVGKNLKWRRTTATPTTETASPVTYPVTSPVDPILIENLKQENEKLSKDFEKYRLEQEKVKEQETLAANTLIEKQKSFTNKMNFLKDYTLEHNIAQRN